MLGVIDEDQAPRLRRISVPALGLRNDLALAAVLRLEDRGPTEGLEYSHAIPYWIAVARFVLELLADQRFIPTLIQPRSAPNGLRAAWKPWLHDDSAGRVRTHVLAERSAELVVKVIGMLSNPLLRPLRKSALEMLAEIRATSTWARS